jgi:hypothetical protein
MFQRHPLMQQADAAGGGQGAAAGAPGGAGARSRGSSWRRGRGQERSAAAGWPAGQGARGRGLVASGGAEGNDPGTQSTDAAKGTGAADAAKTGDQAQIAIKLPAGAEANPSAVEAGKHYGAWAKTAGLSQEHAQKAFDYFVERSRESEGALQKQIVKYIDTLKADKEFGGANYDKTLAARDSALKQFFGDEVGNLFKELGIDHHPGVAKGLARIRASISEDAVGDKGGKPAPGMTTREAELRRMFPNSYDQMVGKQKSA